MNQTEAAVLINKIRKYHVYGPRIYTKDEYVKENNLFITTRRATIKLRFVGTVFDAFYCQYYNHDNIDPAGVGEIRKFRPGKWVSKYEEAIQRIENELHNERFAPVKDGWLWMR